MIGDCALHSLFKHSCVTSLFAFLSSFKYFVVDTNQHQWHLFRPTTLLRALLETLSAAGIPSTYVFLNAAAYAMTHVTKVFMGTAAIMANGAVLATTGTVSRNLQLNTVLVIVVCLFVVVQQTSFVPNSTFVLTRLLVWTRTSNRPRQAVMAMTARSRNVPVIFCCETYKLCERVQLDSIVSNELGNPEELVSVGSNMFEEPLQGWKQTNGCVSSMFALLPCLSPFDSHETSF